jgi:hypothetical protein
VVYRDIRLAEAPNLWGGIVLVGFSAAVVAHISSNYWLSIGARSDPLIGGLLVGFASFIVAIAVAMMVLGRGAFDKTRLAAAGVFTVLIIAELFAARSGMSTLGLVGIFSALVLASIGSMLVVEMGNWNPVAAIVLSPFTLAHRLGVSLAIYVVSLVIRIAATLAKILEGLRALPRNFRRLIMCISPAQEPELVPSLDPRNMFRLSRLIADFKNAFDDDS